MQLIIDGFPFERYGRVNLPYGLYSKGLDRTFTRNMILPKSLKGKSFLDVGSAYGYFCFEAESIGANKVLGLEIKSDRLDRANIFKKINNSNVSFENKNILNKSLNESFDYIIILNVLHHLKEKCIDVIDYLYSITNEVLVIESPKLRGLHIDQIMQNYKFSEMLVFESLLEGPEEGVRKIVICKK